MRRKLPVGIVAVACLVLMAWATPADAQRRAAGRGVRSGGPRISIGAYFGPYYGPYFYSPWFYSSFWLYPPYPYGYPYYMGPASVSIRVQVEPKQAQVYVDGNLAGIVDQFDGFFQSLPVEPGGHDIVVYLEGYHSIVQHMYLSPGKSYRIKGVMERLAAGEPNEPRPQPSLEPREVQPQYRGQEPRELPEPTAPPVERRPREFYPPAEREAPVPVEREAGAPADRDSRFGQVAIRVEPADAQVTIDGEPWRGPEGAERLVVHLPAGTHRVEIHKEGFDPFVTAVEVKRGEVTVLNVSLAKL